MPTSFKLGNYRIDIFLRDSRQCVRSYHVTETRDSALGLTISVRSYHFTETRDSALGLTISPRLETVR